MKKFLILIAILAGLVTAPVSVLPDDTPSATGVSGNTAGKFSDPVNDSAALHQSTPLDPAAATQAWLDSVPQEKREKSDAYFEGG